MQVHICRQVGTNLLQQKSPLVDQYYIFLVCNFLVLLLKFSYSYFSFFKMAMLTKYYLVLPKKSISFLGGINGSFLNIHRRYIEQVDTQFVGRVQTRLQVEASKGVIPALSVIWPSVFVEGSACVTAWLRIVYC